MHVDRSREGRRLALVQDGRDLVGRDHPTGGLHQQRQQIEFHRRQIEFGVYTS
jgi:hypothetical protein